MVHVILDAKSAKRLLSNGESLIAFDTETTGFDRVSDYVIEIGAVRFDKNGLKDKPFSALIKPPIAIPSIITQLTGITYEDVKDAKSEEEVLPSFLEYIEGSVLVAHNVHFDLCFINAALSRAGLPLITGSACDTLTMAKRVWPSLAKGGYKLPALADMCAIDKGHSHRATDDAATCAMLFLRMASIAEEQL